MRDGLVVLDRGDLAGAAAVDDDGVLAALWVRSGESAVVGALLAALGRDAVEASLWNHPGIGEVRAVLQGAGFVPRAATVVVERPLLALPSLSEGFAWRREGDRAAWPALVERGWEGARAGHVSLGGLLARVADSTERVVGVVEREGVAIGVTSHSRLDGEVWVGDVFALFPEARGRGWAVPALVAALRGLRDLGAYRIVDEVDGRNVPMLRSFAAVGYGMMGRKSHLVWRRGDG